jgi:hypothetical protein
VALFHFFALPNNGKLCSRSMAIPETAVWHAFAEFYQNTPNQSVLYERFEE